MVEIVSKVAETSATLRWEDPSYLAGEILHYVLTYTAMNENGSAPFHGTEGELVVYETAVTLDNLSPGSTYNFQVQVDSSLLLNV